MKWTRLEVMYVGVEGELEPEGEVIVRPRDESLRPLGSG